MSSDRPGGPADVVSGDDGELGPRPADRPVTGPAPDAGPAGAPGGAAAEPTPGAARHPTGSRRDDRRRKDRKKGSLLRELPVLLLIALVLALVVKSFFVQAFFIPSGSMETTLHGCTGCTGDRVLVNKVPYWFGTPEPGDIVVFKGPDTWAPEVDVGQPSNWFTGALLWLGRAVGVAPPSEDDFVKRVIAVGGQTVQCCDAQGRVEVDGKPVHEPYIYQDSPLDQRQFAPVTVPAGRLWVMGDHRSESADSRSHRDDKYQGTIAVSDVIGKAAVVVWPLDRIHILHAPDIQSDSASAAAAPSAFGLAAAVPLTAVPLTAVPRVARHRRRTARPERRPAGSRRTPPRRRRARTGLRRLAAGRRHRRG